MLKAATKSTFVDQLWIPTILAVVWFLFVFTLPGQGSGFNNRLAAGMVAAFNTVQIWASGVGIDALATGGAGN